MKRLGLLALTAAGAVALYEVLRRNGTVDKLKGEIKKAAGAATDDIGLELEGHFDTGKGKVKEVVDDVKQGAKRVKKEAEEIVEEISDDVKKGSKKTKAEAEDVVKEVKKNARKVKKDVEDAVEDIKEKA